MKYTFKKCISFDFLHFFIYNNEPILFTGDNMSNDVLEQFKNISNRLNSLKDKAMKINAIVENSTQQASKFQEAAKKKFNVDTPEELAIVISNIDKENSEKVEQYQKDVEEFQNSVLTKEELIRKIQEDNQ